jgi:hypothetical protein
MNNTIGSQTQDCAGVERVAIVRFAVADDDYRNDRFSVVGLFD